MNITSTVFQAYLECPTKCFLRVRGEVGTGNEYANWVRTETESYRHRESDRLVTGIHPRECIRGLTNVTDLKTVKCRLALDVLAKTGNQESEIHAVETVPSEGRGKAAQFIPIRFIFRNKLTTNDKLLLAYDASVLSGMLGRSVPLGKIIHGDDHSTFKVKTATLHNRVGKLTEKIGALLSTDKPPDLVLNRHCGECEFQTHCRQKAVEKDDLSLLSGMSEKERKKLNSKGIFTVTQLSYTFRPRRRPKKLRDKKEKYHHSLKALAIREKKIHIVGTPELKIEGTPVYFDVEGLPDRDFYYLIGMRVGDGESAIQHSLWADTVDDEKRIWHDFLTILDGIQNPVLVHYGSYETTFLKRMCERYGKPPEGSAVGKAVHLSVNILSLIYAQIYFPTFANGLKEIAGWLGFKWTYPNSSGRQAVVWRVCARDIPGDSHKTELFIYNREDCEALALLGGTVIHLATFNLLKDSVGRQSEVVRTNDLKPPLTTKWREFSSPLSELEFVTKAARWDYQRDRVYVRSGICPRHRQTHARDAEGVWRVDKVVRVDSANRCPNCNKRGVKYGPVRSKTVHEMMFGRFSLKTRFVRREQQPYWCSKCNSMFGVDETFRKRGRSPKFDRNLLAYIFYQVIELFIPVRIVGRSLSRFFGLTLTNGTGGLIKEQMADYYSQTHQQILDRILSGNLVHADETNANIKGKGSYVWVFTNMKEVAYLYSESREGDLVEKLLGKFNGVLVSDFYAVYDSLDCPQQKCLIHLVRDLNGAILDHPYDDELKCIVRSFGQLLKTIVEDVDRCGLKRHFLRKHRVAVDHFYRKVVQAEYQSPAALACRERFEKNRNRLFTFLEFDNIPWNNNNAEHAIKAFARLRDVIEGSSTEKGTREYLILLSICQTCKYQGLDFLDFLRSGEKDIEAFAQSKGGRRRHRVQ